MPQALQLRRKIVLPKFSNPKFPGKQTEFTMSRYVLDEINAFIAIRDIALAEFESELTALNLKRARIANDFVVRSLKPTPAGSPYESQHLPETMVVAERARCEAVRLRIALLQAHMYAPSLEHAHAA